MATSRKSLLGVLMKVNLSVKRYDPEKTKDNNWLEDYQMDIHQSSTVLDALIHVREEIDGTLGLRCACRASICGSCGMKVNGQAKLVCKTRVEELSPDGEILFEKSELCLENGLGIIFCFGEELSDRKLGKHFEVIEDQLFAL